MKISGVSFTELLVTLGLISLLMLTLSASWLSTQQINAQLMQVQIAENLLNNAAWLRFAAPNVDLNQYLSNTSLLDQTIVSTAQGLQISWSTQKPLQIHCIANNPKTACIGF